MKLFYYLQEVRNKYQFKPFDLIYIYLLGGLIGTIYEEIYYLVTINKFVNSSGSVFLPFNVVYGCGVLFITLCFYNISNWLIIWLLAGLSCGFVEYIMSLISELFLGAVSWNYQHSIMNINGRTTIPFMVIWGLAGMLILVLIIPFFIRLIHKIPPNIHRIISIILIVIIVSEMIISLYALFRYSQRHYGIYIDNPIAIWFDQTFNDQFMKEKYPNFVFLNE